MKSIQIVYLCIISFFLLTGFKLYYNPVESIYTAGDNLAEYEVRFTHTGYMLFYGTLEDCPINPSGKVVLKGRLSGAENVGRYDPIHYTGVLALEINIDICSAKRASNGEDKLCGMTVKGRGRVYTELELDTAGRSAYIKISYDSTRNGRFEKTVFGTCDQEQMAEEEYMTPNETIAAIFNGRDLPKLINHRTLRVGRYIERDGGNETLVEVIRKIR
jgi:hypothetical protein